MSLRYYMDVHVPAAITEALSRRNLDVLTSQDDGTREATDEVLLRRAAELDRILVSQDHDLLRIAADWQSRQESFPGLILRTSKERALGNVSRIWN